MEKINDFEKLKQYVQNGAVENKMLHLDINEKIRKEKFPLRRWNRTTVTLITYRSEACTPHQ